MYNGLKYTFIFSLGAAVGVAASWNFLKTKYERMAQEDINVIKESYANKYDDKDEPKEEVVNEPTEPTADPVKTEYKNLVAEYTSNSDTTEKGDSEAMCDNGPRIITPDDYGTMVGYDAETLTYYKDGVITDEDDNIIEDVEGLLGCDPGEHFGEYEKYAVYVRNDEQLCDYEILMDNRSYVSLNPEYNG